MGNVMKVLLLILFFVMGAYLSGVRVHPEALSGPSLPVAVPAHKGVELVFKNGQRASGQIVKETADGIIFNIEGAEVNFTNDEILSRSEVSIPSREPLKRADQQNMPIITYDPSISIFSQIAGKGPEKKQSFQASSLWGVKPRTAAGSMPSQVKADPNSLVGIYNKSMSRESLESWKNETLSTMGQGRNPIVEAYRAAESKAKASDTSRSEAKLKALEEQG